MSAHCNSPFAGLPPDDGAAPPPEPEEGGKITNAEFIRQAVGSLPEGAFGAVCTKAADPGKSGWPARRADQNVGGLTFIRNNYLNCSSFYPGKDGLFKARKDRFAACHFLMLDDLGTKVPLDRLGTFELSWLIETSPGNHQGGIILRDPLTNGHEAVRLLNAVIAAGLCDAGASGPLSRWARLPVAINGKPKYHDETGAPFQCRLVKWRPDKTYSPDEIVAGLQLVLPPAGRPKAERKHKTANHAAGSADTSRGNGHSNDSEPPPNAEGDLVVAALKARGLYKSQLETGKHDITCPWVQEHTDALDTGAAYFEPDERYPGGGFCCQHSHGGQYHIRDLLNFLGTPALDGSPMPFGYTMRPDGVYWRNPDDAEATPTHVCGPLRVAAVTNDGTGHAWGRRLQWPDANGHPHDWAMPMELLAGEDTGIRARLLDGGLYVAAGRSARGYLTNYIQHSKPKDQVRVVARIGWHGSGGSRVFVLPGGAIGADGADHVMLQTDRPDAMPPVAQSGTLADWQDKVARLAVGNSRLAFSLAIAFAAPLVGLIGAEGGGFHLRGPSSVGKSTALQAAGSVWGGGGLRGWVRSWRTTDNSLEAVAASHNDLLLVLDEMGEAGAETVAASAYMLANGAGKGRAGRDGSARRAAEWRLLFLSSGEDGIAGRLAEARGGPIRIKAGQEVRVLDVPANARPHGLFETLHGSPSAGALADSVKAGAATCYGTAGREWLERLVADPDGMTTAARDVMAAFLEDRLPVGADGQVGRAAQRFALVAAAGELAAGVGLLPWEPGEAERAAAACFRAWKDARAGGTGAAEDAAAIAAVRRCIGAYGESRFQNIDAPDDRPVLNRLGWRKKDNSGWRYLFLPEAWKADAVPGLDPEAAARALRAAGYLVPQSPGAKRHSRMERVGLSGPVRVYAISESILAGADPEVGEEAGEASP